MTFRTRSLASLIACASLLSAHAAHAEPTAAEISAARRAFDGALDAETEQRWADAALKLREAIAVKDTPGLRFHLAHCETELGHLVGASLEYDRALELMRRGAKAPDVQKLLEPARSALLARIPRLTLDIPADAQSPRVSIDNRAYPASEAELGVPLDPGLHQLRVLASGRGAFERALSLKEGDRLVLPVVLPLAAPPGGPSEPAPEPTPKVSPPTAAAPPERRASPAKLYLMIGESLLTAAGLGVGIGYAIARGSATDRIDTAQSRIETAAPDNPTACATPTSALLGACSDLEAAIDDHHRAVMVSEVGFVSAGIGATALLTTWLVYPSGDAPNAGLSVQPTVGFGRLGLIGRF